jgi:hypothetical protein
VNFDSLPDAQLQPDCRGLDLHAQPGRRNPASHQSAVVFSYGPGFQVSRHLGLFQHPEMLQINKPWLQPAELPATYSYSLHRRYAGYFLNRLPQKEESDSGPFIIAPGCSPPVRVGSIMQTPLHAMMPGQN